MPTDSRTPGADPLLHLDVPAVVQNVGVVRHVVDGLIDQGTISPQALNRVRLGVSEAVTQAVVAAGPEDRVEVRVWLVGDGTLRVLVSDARDPVVAARSDGLSRETVAAVTQRTAVRRAPGGGTELEMRFAIGSAARQSMSPR